MKAILLLTIIGLFVVPLGLLSFYRWDTAANRGSDLGYWGDFNRTSNALASIPGITITGKWHNLDVTLEGFAFAVITNGEAATLFFRESDPIRNMSPERAIAALKERIKEEISGTNKTAFGWFVLTNRF